MPPMMGCTNCGYSCHASHAHEYCPLCGRKLKPGTDSREFGSPQSEREFQEYQRLKKKFEGKS